MRHLNSVLVGLNALVTVLMMPSSLTALIRCCMICQARNGILHCGRCLMLIGIGSGTRSMLFSRRELQAMLFQLMSLFLKHATSLCCRNETHC